VEHPKSIGDRSTLAIMLALQAAGLPFLVPFGENTRYDLVVELDGRLVRVQCKTGRTRRGVIEFKVCSSYAHLPSPRARARHYEGEVDYFAVYCPQTSGVYLIPIENVPNRWTGSLRLEPTRNRQRLGVRLARDYEIGKVRLETAGSATREPAASAGA
jgi:PD-(D/E)XK endonuclease